MSEYDSLIEMGEKFPYDAPDAWNRDYPNVEPIPSTDWAHKAARAIIQDLKDRAGISYELETIEEKYRIEIIAKIAWIIRLCSARAGTSEVKHDR